jgi:DNA invertase Pin-like site-specific DNA recombinase
VSIRNQQVGGSSPAEPDLMTNDPTRKLMRQFMGAIAEYDKSQIVLKLRGARMRKRAKEGRSEGRKPYGFYEGEAAALTRKPRRRTLSCIPFAFHLEAIGQKP